ncbi:putative vacuolar sorting receptor (Mrl1) [Aspergillus lucknowensis]|uniref:Mannose-6-phosphate receptor binding domain-containing protein n=1 Tax=Aspergillus lucknowensis TaxID=176173 RepID=A0ABR4M3G1_9EURO
MEERSLQRGIQLKEVEFNWQWVIGDDRNLSVENGGSWPGTSEAGSTGAEGRSPRRRAEIPAAWPKLTSKHARVLRTPGRKHATLHLLVSEYRLLYSLIAHYYRILTLPRSLLSPSPFFGSVPYPFPLLVEAPAARLSLDPAIPAMKSPFSLLTFFLASTSLTSVYAAPQSYGSNDDLAPCVARSPTTGLYYDLNSLTVQPSPSDSESSRKHSRDESWHAKGYDYNANFTLNICGPVIEELTDVVGVNENLWQNVSAYYQKEGKTYSIGQQASDPFFRGRKLVMNYTDGSPCDGDDSRTKSTLISFLCDRDVSASQSTFSFVGTMDHCTYFFDVRSSAACGGYGHDPAGQGLSPGGIFCIIVLIAIVVYLLGGCAYQRTVMHQRGWRQCPNYSIWAGIADFMKDMTIILFSSFLRLFRVRRSPAGYAPADSQRGAFSGGRRGRAEDMDAENRLIDQLDEEWDD